MDPDIAVGERLAELRKQQGLRQEDFLDLLSARGVSWTQTVLSRVEGGKRALKATELFAIADALGIEAGQLNPAGDGLYYRLQSLRLKYREARSNADRAAYASTVAKERLVALTLVNEIREGRSTFTVHGTPSQFIELVGAGVSDDEGNLKIAVAQELVGVDAAEIFRTRDEILDAEHPDVGDPSTDNTADAAYADAEDKAYLLVFASRLPSLTFVPEPQGRFWVDGIDVDSPVAPFWLTDLLEEQHQQILHGTSDNRGG